MKHALVMALALGCGVAAAQPPMVATNPVPTVAPETAEQHIHDGLSFARKGEWGAAITAFDAALAIEPTQGHALLFKGQAEAAQKEYEAALRSFAAALPLLPHEPLIYSAIGEVHAARGDRTRAANAIALAANICLRQNDRAQAATLLQRLREIDPASPQVASLATRLEARIEAQPDPRAAGSSEATERQPPLPRHDTPRQDPAPR